MQWPPRVRASHDGCTPPGLTDPCLFLLDLHQVRGGCAGFRCRDEVGPDAFGGKVAYDVGAAYYAELCQAGLTWTRCPAFQAGSATSAAHPAKVSGASVVASPVEAAAGSARAPICGARAALGRHHPPP
jgi:hypothetical protein